MFVVDRSGCYLPNLAAVETLARHLLFLRAVAGKVAHGLAAGHSQRTFMNGNDATYLRHSTSSPASPPAPSPPAPKGSLPKEVSPPVAPASH